MKKSYIKVGEYTSNFPNKKPTFEAVYSWWNEFKKTPHLEDYEVYICGAVLEDVKNTWDVDIVRKGDIRYPNELKFILDEGIRIGLKYWLLVDIKWASKVFDFINEGYQPHSIIRSFNKFKMYKDKEIKTTIYNEEIYPGLFKKELKKEPNSFKWGRKMINKGKYTLGIQKLSEYIYNNKHKAPEWLQHQQ